MRTGPPQSERRATGVGAVRILVLAGIAVVLIAPPGLGLAPPPGPAVTDRPSAPPVSPGTLLSRAVASLGTGAGPAHGAAWSCRSLVATGYGCGAGARPRPADLLGPTSEWLATPPLPASPSPESAGALAYDSTGGCAVLFGGQAPSGSLSNQTWTFSAGGWTQAVWPGTVPSPRMLPAFSDDPAEGGALLFGGAAQTGYLNDTWLFRCALGWTQLHPTVTSISPRAGASLAFDPTLGHVVLFGGFITAFPSYDSHSFWFVNGSWLRLAAAPGTLGGRAEAAFAFDARDQQLLLYGGYGPTAPYGPAGWLNDTWSFSGGNWTSLTFSDGVSPALVAPMLAYDAPGSTVLLMGFAGSSSSWSPPYGAGSLLSAWNFSDGGWSLASGESAFAASPNNGAFGAALVSGAAGDPLLFTPGGPSFCSDTTFVEQNGRWQPARAEFGSGPCSPMFSAVTYDGADGYVLAFGGYSYARGAASAETWSYQPGGWTNLTSSVGTPPSARHGASMVYDPIDQEVVLFGGNHAGPGCTPHAPPLTWLCDDTWTFAGGRWSPVATSPSGTPSSRYGASAVWDPDLPGVLLSGGRTDQSTLADSWVFLGSAWRDLTSAVNGTPGSRAFAASTYDPLRGGVVVSGGFSWNLSAGVSTRNDTMLFANGNWTTLGSGGDPPGRWGASLTYVPELAGDLLIGGDNQSGIPTPGLAPYLLSSGGWVPIVLPADTYGPQADLGASLLDLEGAVNPLLLVGGSQTESDGVPAWLLGSAVTLGPLIASTSTGEVGAPLSLWTTTSGGSTYANLTFSGLPPGCQAPAAAFVGCVPTTSGLFQVAVTMDDPASRTTLSDSLSLSVAPGLTFASVRLSADWVDLGQTLDITPQTTGGIAPFQVAYTGLPPGCPASDQPSLSCVPDQVGNYTVRTTVIDALGRTANGSARVMVGPTPTFAEAAVVPAALDIGQPFTVEVAADQGRPPYRYAFSDLPPGCLPATTPTFVCLPNVAGNFTLRANVTDSVGGVTSAALTVTINPLLSITSFSADNLTIPTNGTTVLTTQTSGGTGPFTYSYQVQPDGCLPSTGPAIVCAPGRPGYYLVTATVTDASGYLAAAEAGFTVNFSASSPPTPIAPRPGPNGSVFPSGNGLTPIAVLLAPSALAVGVLFYLTRRRTRTFRRRAARLAWALLHPGEGADDRGWADLGSATSDG